MENLKRIDKSNVEDILSLTPLQEGILFHYLKDPHSDNYFVQLCLEILGVLDAAAVEQAWNVVIDANEMLRTVFRWEMVNDPIQVILEKHPLRLTWYDRSNFSPHENKRLAGEMLSNDRKNKFNLEERAFRVTMCKKETGKFIMLITHHHILYDGWSQGIILKEFFHAYDCLSRGWEPRVPVKARFSEFVKWRQRQDRESQRQYWTNYLKGVESRTFLSSCIPGVPAIPGDKIENPVGNGGENYDVQLEEGIVNAIAGFIGRERVTLASLLYGAWGILLYKYCDNPDVVFGVTVSGRPSTVKGIENSVGLLINTVPLRMRITPEGTVARLLAEVRDSTQTRRDFESVSLVDIHNYSGSKHDLFDTLVVIENYPRPGKGNICSDTLEVESYRILEKTNYYLTLSVSTANGLEITIESDPQALELGFVERMAGHFQTIMRRITANPDESIGRLDMLAESEKEQLLYDFNNTTVDFPGEEAIHERFAQQVTKTPGSVAVVCRDHRFTYGEVNARANRLAGKLRSRGVTVDTIVAILVKRSLEMVLGMMGVSKAGGAYLPIGTEFPGARVRYLWESSGAVVMLTQKELYRENKEILAKTLAGKIMYIDDGTLDNGSTGSTGSTGSPGPIASISRPDHLIYVNYTSGSTGRPKGVMIEHRSVSNYIAWVGRTFHINSHTHYLNLTDYTFDASVTDIFGSLVHGAALYLGEKDLIFSPEGLARYVEEKGITLVDFVPRVLQELLCYRKKLRSLHTILVGGEALENSVKEQIIGMGYALSNHYGPTETTVDALVSKCSGKKVTLGKPIANSRCYILRGNEPVPVGVTGEICISGAGLARGYLNLPQLTVETFTDNPLFPGRRMYRTGDLGRWLADGDVEFVGRIDHQVKIRGNRIELGEIESCLETIDPIKEALVISGKDVNNQDYLCAYLVADVQPHPLEIKRILAKDLPAYAIPSYFIRLDRFPVLPGGKIDRKALPAPGRANALQTAPYEAPQKGIEKRIAKIWNDMLGIKDVGIDDNFFDIGGNSLYIIRLTSRLKNEFGRDIPVVAVFDYPTIRSFAQYLNFNGKTGSIPGQREDIQNRINKGWNRIKQKKKKMRSHFHDGCK